MMNVNKKVALQSPEEVEAVYYESFRRGDSNVMAALWADGDVICVHPGSGAVIGYESVVRSWRHIFANTGEQDIAVSLIRRTVTDEIAIHLVAEEPATGVGSSAVVLATNVYRKYNGGWLMIEHHASLVEAQQEGRTLQ